MQNPIAQQIDVVRYLRLFWKRKWIIVLPALIFPLVGGYYAMQMKDKYMSSAVILVTPQKVPENFVQSTVTTSIQERLRTISEQIFSRTRLEQIINEFNLFEEESQARAPEEVISMMRDNIKLNVKQSNSFALSFTDASPRTAMLVTNKLASLFIEENLKVREQQAIGTSQFLSDEIDRYREKVREKEGILYQYKQEHLNELPEQLGSNQARLAQLQSQLQINNQSIDAAKNRKIQLQQQLAEIERRVEEEKEIQSYGESSISDMLTQQFFSSGAEGPYVDDSSLRAIQAEIEKREQYLEQMLLTYTEKHPDVVRFKTELAAVKKKGEEEQARIEEERAALQQAEPDGEPMPDLDVGPQYPPVYHQIKADISRANSDISRLTAQNKEIQEAIEVYQTWISRTPARQLEMQALSEDYDNLRSVLESLINKKLQADLSENLERKQKGEQFKILDPANLPNKPFYPNRLRFVGGGLLAGLALGFGVVLLLDLLDFSVKSRDDVIAAIDTPVLGEIPEIMTADGIRRRWLWRLGSTGVAAVFLLVAVGMIHLKFKPLPEAVGDLYAQVKATHWTTVR